MKLQEETLVYFKQERHFKIDVNGKEIWVSKWVEQDGEFYQMDGDIEIFKGKELLSEDEIEEVLEFVEDL